MTPATLISISPMTVSIDCSEWAVPAYAARGEQLLSWIQAQPAVQRLSVRLPARQELRPLRQKIQSLGCQVTVRTPCSRS
jgi:hypothetical protein